MEKKEIVKNPMTCESKLGPVKSDANDHLKSRKVSRETREIVLFRL